MATDLANGVVLGGCRLGPVLGRGGMGLVYRATQLALDREVAIKVVPAHGVEPALVERFKREARLAAAVEHPHLVPIYAAGEEEGLLYLVMRLVAGCDLGAHVAREGPLTPERAVTVLEQVASALDALHGAGLVHRDVKPANVLMEGERAYLSDFGLMRQAIEASAITCAGDWVGTPSYSPPEQLDGRPVDARADVYSLAAVLYTALTGRTPFPRETPVATALAHLHEHPPRPAGRLGPIVARGMAKAPEQRYRTAGELAQAARRAVSGGRRLPRRAAAVAVAVAVLAGAAGGVSSLTDGRQGTTVRRASIAKFGPAQFSKLGPAQFSSLGPAQFSYPWGWRLVENERPLGAFVRSTVLSPDGSEMAIIDRSPNQVLALGDWARAVERAAAAQTPGYRELSFGPETVAGRRAFVWTFEVRASAYPARVDIFERLGGDGYAVLGEGRAREAVARLAATIARSVRGQ